MEIPEILQKYYKTWYQIKILRLKADGMRKSLYGKGASGSQSSSMNTHDGMSKGILTMIDYEKKADNLKNELDRIRNETENIIEKVQDDNQKELLVRRYLLFRTGKTLRKV